ncbi:MAG: methyltransferase domain-containing protein [Phycisphaerae bacterium]|nr:methyltransferase domain-containing protein [Phycisphaerae bacterium]
MTDPSRNIWGTDYKIPWNDPDFSRRMLNEHLSQQHDLASRRTEWIDRQVAWIHARLLAAQPSRVLDLGCGPGLYSHRLARLGHACCGIDFGPASINYARRHSPEGSVCDFILGDIRRVGFGGPYELAMVLYGELNAFSPAEASAILSRARASLSPQGLLIVEVQSADAVEAIGRGEPTEQEFQSGLFSDRPHRCRTENQWLPDHQAAVQTFIVTETRDSQARVFRSTTQAWPDDSLVGLLTAAGFATPSRCEAWPRNTDMLSLWTASTR